MTRLERHRIEFENARRMGPLLPLDDLDPEEVALVNRSFLERCRRDRVDGIDQMYEAYVGSLHEWGVMCPHPQHLRLYDGWQRSDSPLPFTESPWFSCGICRAAVMNR